MTSQNVTDIELSHWKTMNENMMYYFPMKVIFVSLYTMYFANTIRQFKNLITAPMREIMISFESIMVIRLICDITVTIVDKINNFTDRKDT